MSQARTKEVDMEMTRPVRKKMCIRDRNKVKIAKFIRYKGSTSKPEIAAELGISMPTVLQNVKELTEAGIVGEIGEYESTGGRKAKTLSITAAWKMAVGLDLSLIHI